MFQKQNIWFLTILYCFLVAFSETLDIHLHISPRVNPSHSECFFKFLVPNSKRFWSYANLVFIGLQDWEVYGEARVRKFKKFDLPEFDKN